MFKGQACRFSFRTVLTENRSKSELLTQFQYSTEDSLLEDALLGDSLDVL